jgi:hypothetical protein
LDTHHQQFVDVFLGLANFLPQLSNLSIQHRLAKRPLFVELLQVCLLFCPAFPERFCVLYHLGIQALF